jgi:hypothetical protein
MVTEHLFMLDKKAGEKFLETIESAEKDGVKSKAMP